MPAASTAVLRSSASLVANADSNHRNPLKVFNQARPYGGKVLTLMSFANRALSKVCQAVSKYASNTVLGHKAGIKAKELKLEMLEWTRDSAQSKLTMGKKHAKTSPASPDSRTALQTNLDQLSTQLLALGNAVTRQEANVNNSQSEYQTFMTDRQTNKVNAKVAAMSARIESLLRPASQPVTPSYNTFPDNAMHAAKQQP